MANASLLARLGLRLGTLGSLASLAIAAPVTEGDLSQAAHTGATRIGVYFSRSGAAATHKIAFVVRGTESASITSAGVTCKSITAYNGSGTMSEGFGDGALGSSPSGNDNTAVGYHAGYTLGSASRCVAIGSLALRDNQSGGDNIAIGYAALAKNLAGENISIGSYSSRDVTGVQNVVIGHYSLVGSTLSSFNSALGYNAMQAVTSIYGCTAIGHSALYSATSGNYNTGVGDHALYHVTTGTNNTALGYNAGHNAGTPSRTVTYCTFLGNAAISTTDAITNSTAIGNGAAVAASNQIRLGNSSVTEVSTYGTLNLLGDTSATSIQTLGGITLASGKALTIGTTQIIGAQGAAVADATDAASAITQLNALLARCRTHGLIAT